MSDELCSLHSALRSFAEASATQSQEHIKPLHWHIAERLVVEGGFAPEDVTPRPPLRVEPLGAGRDCRYRLIYDAAVAQPGEQIVLGGLKTKLVDVVVSRREIGPCLAVSVKGSLNAFRNLTNRMEEAAGDCTNIHLVYPAMVYGFLHIIKANREQDVDSRNDVAIHASGAIVAGIARYHDAMARLSGAATCATPSAAMSPSRSSWREHGSRDSETSCPCSPQRTVRLPLIVSSPGCTRSTTFGSCTLRPRWKAGRAGWSGLRTRQCWISPRLRDSIREYVRWDRYGANHAKHTPPPQAEASRRPPAHSPRDRPGNTYSRPRLAPSGRACDRLRRRSVP